ncbi:MAG: DUF6064 family protein [Longimicrobiales bacterium]
MQPPFATEQFMEVILRYNQTVWPIQILFYVGAVALLWLAVVSSRSSDRWVSGILAFFWAWMAVVYHWLFFTAITPAAWVFGALFLVQAVVFLAAGLFGDRLAFEFEGDAYGVIGAVFLAYGLLFYPIFGALAGHTYPESPTFGLPCPTTIVTFGVLLWASRRVPIHVVLIPAIWGLIGGSAAIQFAIPEDYGLIVAGVLGTVLVLLKNRRLPTAAEVPVTEP